MRTKIDVPKEFEKHALDNGAIYDKKSKEFYVPRDKFISVFNPYIPLTIELVPSSNWNKNVRSELATSWDDIRRYSYRQAEYRCEICGGVGPDHPVECHETWDFDMKTKTQRLTGLISLCPLCHMAKHIGLAFTKSKGELVIDHIQAVNGWTRDDADKYIGEAFHVYEVLSTHSWKLNLSYLDTLNI